MACTYFRVLFLACDGRRRGDPNDVEDVNHVVSSLVIPFGWHQRSSGQLHNRLDYLYKSIDCRSNDCRSNDCRSNECRSIDCWINGKTPRICCMPVGWDVHWCPVSRMATPRHANARFEFRKRRGSCVSIVRRLDNPTLLHKIEKR